MSPSSDDHALRDWSRVTHVHGQDMQRLSELKAAQPGQIVMAYGDVQGGAELAFTTTDGQLLNAIHKWFDAQLSGHGKDATSGHAHHGMAR